MADLRRALDHELRTPLTAILGMSTTLQLHAPELSTDRRRAMVDGIVRNLHRLARLLGDLLDLGSRADTPPPCATSIAIADHVRRAVDHADLRPRVDLALASRRVWADPVLLDRVLAHLFDNIVRHVPPDARVRVRTRADHILGGTVITVEDDGPGIPDDIQPVVLRPFIQGPKAAAAARPGLGIGLAVVAELVDRHGGQTWVTTPEGGGTAVHVALPDPTGIDATAAPA